MKIINYHIALVGNPNSGKSSLFNNLTGLRQKTGNYPGVTVEKKQGFIARHNGLQTLITDLPGTYSLYPNSKEELIVSKALTDSLSGEYPDAIIYVCDVTSIKKQLLLFSQILDLKLPTILVLSMGDEARRKGINIRKELLEICFQVPCVVVNSRSKEGYKELYNQIESLNLQKSTERNLFYKPSPSLSKLVQRIQSQLGLTNSYQALVIANHIHDYDFIEEAKLISIKNELETAGFEPLKHQIQETLSRFQKVEPLLDKAITKKESSKPKSRSDKLDEIITHRVFGPLIFTAITLFIFQAIYSWSEYPMAWIENGFTGLSTWISQNLPSSWFSNLLTEGVIAGISGVLIFIPQIAVLFLLITILEEFGYMARAVYMCDRFMQAFGLNGRSIIALISGGACAIPAIMSTRTISNFKERLITIMVTPLISCSARLPVYVILVGLAIPPIKYFGFFNLQGIVFSGLYVLGIASALISAFVFHRILKIEDTSYLALEMPDYRVPMLKNVLFTVYEKVKSFVVEAGKIIFLISIFLWFLSSYSFPGQIKNAESEGIQEAINLNLPDDRSKSLIAAKKLEASFAGKIGKTMEPVIEPLGYDWKIGIALLTSFAAREVFVGTMATIYSVGNDDTVALREKMRKEVNRKTNQPVFSIPTSLSLLIFYVFAMQCMSTLAVVKRETNSWKWPVIQFAYMGAMAYVAAFVVYHLSSTFFV